MGKYGGRTKTLIASSW